MLFYAVLEFRDVVSPSSRRAWIEIAVLVILLRVKIVALLAEGVDRNLTVMSPGTMPPVALLAEGVDRNFNGLLSEKLVLTSPSSRRAWIEICSAPPQQASPWSPSSRRAWIEIGGSRGRFCWLTVALLAEGVDRNSDDAFAYWAKMGRPPRGGRG